MLGALLFIGMLTRDPSFTLLTAFSTNPFVFSAGIASLPCIVAAEHLHLTTGAVVAPERNEGVLLRLRLLPVNA